MNQSQAPQLLVANSPISDPVPYARNARTHSAEQIAQIAASIQELGFYSPPLVGPNETASPAMPGSARRAESAVQMLLGKYRRLGRRLIQFFVRLLRGSVGSGEK